MKILLCLHLITKNVLSSSGTDLFSKNTLQLTEDPQGIEIILPDKKQIKSIDLYVRKQRGGDLETRFEK